MKRLTLLIVALLGLLLAGAVVGSAVLSALSAADSLERARARLSSAESRSGVEQAIVALRVAREDVDRSEQVLARWPVDVVTAVPVLGRSWEAERAVAQSASAVVDTALVLADGLPSLTAGAGGIDLAALERLQVQLSDSRTVTQQAVRALDTVELFATPPQVQEAVRRTQAALEPAVEGLGRARSGLELMSGLLGGSGPRSVLIMVQNNAELRGAGGYAASFATGTASDGRLQLGPLRDVFETGDSPQDARQVPAPEEYLEDYEPLSANTTMWRSWNMSPHVPDSALVGARIAGVLLEQEPDVVVLIDVPAMGALARLSDGRVSLPDGSVVTADELVQALLVDSYAAAGGDQDTQHLRRARLQAAAGTVVRELLAGGILATDAARTLLGLAQERHLSVWSARPQEQEVLEELGLAGAVTPPQDGDLAHVSVNNLGANKLDLYVDRTLSVDVTVAADVAHVVQRVTFQNQAPPGLVPYVEGYDRPGLLVSRVEFSLPARAMAVSASVEGGDWGGSYNQGGERQRLSTVVRIPRGGSSDLEVRYALPLPDGRYRLRVVPQALVEDAELRLRLRSADGGPLTGVTGAGITAGRVEEVSALTRVREVTVDARQEEPLRSRWDRLRRWWGGAPAAGVRASQ